MKELEVITEILKKAVERNPEIDRNSVLYLKYLIEAWHEDRSYEEFYDRVYGMAWGLEIVDIITLNERNKIFDCLLKGFRN